MEETELHVHHPHHHSSDRLSQTVALFTALLAVLGAILGYQTNQLMDEVLLQKNDAVLLKAHATDQWNYYQSVSTKMHLMELAKDLSPEGKQKQFDQAISKYKKQKTAIKASAEQFEAQSAKANKEVSQLDAPHSMLAMAMIMFQIAVALASVTALTKRTWLLVMAGLSATLGIVVWVMACTVLY